MSRAVRNLLSLVASLAVTVVAAAQPVAPPPTAPAAGATLPVIDGPAPPTLPDTVARDDAGRVTVRAVRLDAPLDIDGRLNEPIYTAVHPMDGFIQQEPREGQAATERTDVWVAFDETTLYISAHCWDTAPEREVVNERRRDHVNIYQNENFIVAIDTYYDRRNSFLFQTNPLGALRDGYITDERVHNVDWSTAWNVRSARDETGWTFEMAIPFKSLRFKAPGDQIWGINFLRVVRWKNELSHLTRVPAAWAQRGIYKASSFATLVGVQAPGARNLELKPYVTGLVRTDNVGVPPRRNDPGGDIGGDMKFGITKSLTGDLTYNTDFAQVEDDEAQVNLTRFSVFFPEKREFFLEGQGIFQFGGVSTRVTPGALTGGNQGPGDTPVVFFSRRIGLNGNRPVPILAGGRVTGRTGKYSIGAIDIQTGGSEDGVSAPTNFSVLRVRRDVLKRGSIGILATNRDVGAAAAGSNQVFGLDTGLAFRNSWTMDGAYVRSQSGRGRGDGTSYWGRVNFAVDRYGAEYEHLYVGPGFNPEVGFLRRIDFRRNFGQVRFSPRLARSRLRQVHNELSLDYVTNPAGRLETRVVELSTRGDFRGGDNVQVRYLRDFEYLTRPFQVATNVAIPVGGYTFQEVQASFSAGPQRPIAGRVGVTRGQFFDGDRTETSYSGRVQMTASLALEPAVSVNWVRLPAGDFTNTVARSRAVYTLSPRSFVGALLQYSSATHAVSANVRWRWEYSPGSDIFVVLTEGRDTSPRGGPTLQNRGVVVKMTRLFRF